MAEIRFDPGDRFTFPVPKRDSKGYGIVLSAAPKAANRALLITGPGGRTPRRITVGPIPKDALPLIGSELSVTPFEIKFALDAVWITLFS